MSSIGLLGDTHGNGNWTVNAIQRFHENGIQKVVQAGDFGIYDSQSGARFAKRVNLLLQKHEMMLYVIPGNHEDWDFIDSMHVHDDGWMHYRSNIYVSPRGHRWEWEGVSFVGLGGAPSVDRTYRESIMEAHPKQKVWWDQEVITQQDVDNVVAGGYADIMITHDVPYGVPSLEDRIRPNPIGFEARDLAYALEGRKLMEQAVLGVKPALLVHGHYHFLVQDRYTGEDFETRILGLDCDGSNYSLGELDLETRQTLVWNRGRYNY
jgi:Icc-related predicted phosphoesterase